MKFLNKYFNSYLNNSILKFTSTIVATIRTKKNLFATFLSKVLFERQFEIKNFHWR